MFHLNSRVHCTITLLALLGSCTAQGNEVVNELESWEIRPRNAVIKDESAPKGYNLLGMGLTLPTDNWGYGAPMINFSIYPPLKVRPYRWDMPAPQDIRPVPRITDMRYSLDGRPYSHTRFDDIANRYGWLQYHIEAPFVPQSIRLEVTFADLEPQAFRLKSKQPVPSAPETDARLAPQNNGYAYKQLVIAGKSNKATALLELVKNEELQGFVFRDGCRATKKTGRVVRTRLLFKRHPRYAPDGDLILHETEYYQPVYRTYEWVYANSKAKIEGNYEAYEGSAITLHFECQTESRLRLSQVLKVPNAGIGNVYGCPNNSDVDRSVGREYYCSEN